MVNRRRIERINLQLNAQLSVVDKAYRATKMELVSSDISSKGVFFTTATPLLVGTKVSLHFILHVGKFPDNFSKKTLLEVSGEVVRTEQNGMAVCFGEECKIFPMNDGRNM